MLKLFLFTFVALFFVTTANSQMLQKGLVIKTAPLSNFNLDKFSSLSVEVFLPINNKSIALHAGYIYHTNNHRVATNYQATNKGFIAAVDYKMYLKKQ